MSTVGFFHTVAGLASRFDDLAAEFVPGAEYFHLVDESVLQELLEIGELTPSITNRICTQMTLAQQAGADLVLDTCSSTSPAVDVARELVDVPILKIDDPMTERAVELGEDIAVVATAGSTLGPSTDLVEWKATERDRSVSIDSMHVDGALDALQDGDREHHDELVTQAALDASEVSDVVVLAQASMSHLEPAIAEETDVPVLSSPDLAMETLAGMVDERTG